MSTEELLLIMRSLLIKGKHIVKEHKMYKIYLPKEFVDIWEYLHKSGRKVDIIVIITEIKNVFDLPEVLRILDKIIMRGRKISKEYNNYKVYLSSRYNDIWEWVRKNNVKVDIILLIK